MRKYGIGWNRLYKAIHVKICPGGTQYQTLKKEGATKPEVKQEKESDAPPPKGRGKGRGKSSLKKWSIHTW